MKQTALTAVASVATLSLLVAFTPNASAETIVDPTRVQPGPYAELGLTRVFTEADFNVPFPPATAQAEFKADSFAFHGRGGYLFNRFFGAEAELGIGIGEANSSLSASVNGVPVDTSAISQSAELDHFVGGFGLAMLPINNRFWVHARAGYAQAEVKAAIGNDVYNISGSEDGPAWGVGARFNFNSDTAIRLDYTQYDFDPDLFKIDASTVQLSVVKSF